MHTHMHTHMHTQAVRIKTMRGRGGGVEDVLYQNLTGAQPRAAITLTRWPFYL